MQHVAHQLQDFSGPPMMPRGFNKLGSGVATVVEVKWRERKWLEGNFYPKGIHSPRRVSGASPRPLKDMPKRFASIRVFPATMLSRPAEPSHTCAERKHFSIYLGV
jgi:hypothetical protein